MQQYTSTFCSLPGHTWYSYTRTNHNRCSSHKAFFCSLLRRWFWEKSLYTKTGKRCVLKPDSVSYKRRRSGFRIYWGGPKTDKKPLAFVGSMSAVTSSSNFHHYNYSLRVWVKNRLFLQPNGGRWITPTEVSSNNDVCWQPHVNLTQEQLNSRKGNWKVVKIHTTQFPEKPW